MNDFNDVEVAATFVFQVHRGNHDDRRIAFITFFRIIHNAMHFVFAQAILLYAKRYEDFNSFDTKNGVYTRIVYIEIKEVRTNTHT